MTKRMTSDELDLLVAARQRWMQVLAKAGRDLYAHEPALRDCAHEFIRPAQPGMAMVRAAMMGQGTQFNVGEMTVTRCAVQLDDGRQGFAYVAGRDTRHAELAALADAHLQGGDQARWMAQLIEPLRAQQGRQHAAQEARRAATQVDFVTMVRGED